MENWNVDVIFQYKISEKQAKIWSEIIRSKTKAIRDTRSGRKCMTFGQIQAAMGVRVQKEKTGAENGACEN